MSRYRWPVHFALLNNDCLWVMDETQLMGIGLLTTAQLQWFRHSFQTYGPTHSLWMSATLEPERLQTVDCDTDLGPAESLNADDLQNERLGALVSARKPLAQAQVTCPVQANAQRRYTRDLAAEVAQVHVPGSLALVVCNRVGRAQQVYQALQKQDAVSPAELHLLHSRFRAAERQALNEQLLGEESPAPTGVWVATQAVEAGVDISADRLFTELPPWSSFVQRVGRCNRQGTQNETAAVYWIDVEDKASAPYNAQELAEGRRLLQQLTEQFGDAGPESLGQAKTALEPLQSAVEGLIPRQHDLLQLFETATDLAGHDIDISPFVRNTEDSDVAIAWRNWEDEGKPPPSDPTRADNREALQSAELCRVPIGQARELVKKRSAWRWNAMQGEWQRANPADLYPGLSLLMACSSGGYSSELGFTGGKEKPEPVSLETLLTADRDSGDAPSQGAKQFVTLRQHAQDVCEQAQRLCDALAALDLPEQAVTRAARWHDAGKAHPHFQAMLTHQRPDRNWTDFWAKSDHQRGENQYAMPSDRRGFRHELASALLALQQDGDFLVAYLVACHHGKVRTAIQPRPNERPPPSKAARLHTLRQYALNPKDRGIEEPPPDETAERYALGIHEGDWVLGKPFPVLDLGDGLRVPPQALSLACMELGESEMGPSWAAQAGKLFSPAGYGPFRLAFLETLVRVADWHGSAQGGCTPQVEN